MGNIADLERQSSLSIFATVKFPTQLVKEHN